MTAVVRGVREARTLWSGLSPDVRRLAWIALILTLVLPVVLQSFGGVAGLRHLAHIVYIGSADNDSWRPMKTAAEALAKSGPASIYREAFVTDDSRAVKTKYQYPPIMAYLLYLDGYLPHALQWHFAFFNIVSLIFFAVNIALICVLFNYACTHWGEGRAFPLRHDRRAATAIVAVLAMSFFPVFDGLDIGQIQTWLNTLFSLALILWVSGRRAAAGVVVGAMCFVKPQLAPLLIWALLRREWRFAAGMGGVGAALGLVSLLAMGLDSHLEYVRVLSFLSSHGESYWRNQSLNGLLHRILLNGPFTDAEQKAAGWPWPPYNLWVHVGTVAFSVLLVGTALFWRMREHACAGLCDLFVIALTLTIASPVAWTHHYGILAPMYAMLLPYALGRPKQERQRLLFWLCLTFVMIGQKYEPLVSGLGVARTPLNILLSTMFLGAMILLWQLYRLRRAGHEPVPVQAGPSGALSR